MAKQDNEKDEIRITYLVNGKEKFTTTVNVDKFADAVKQVVSQLKAWFTKHR